jgi:hypothetical protein
MKNTISLTIACAALAAFAFAPCAWAQLPSGGITGSGIASALSSTFFPSTYLITQRYRRLKIAGRFPVDEQHLPKSAKIVRLSVNGRVIPMRLDTELVSADLEFPRARSYGRDLYRAILTKRIEVVGNSAMRQQIVAAAAKSTPLQIKGYVFDRTSPYLVVQSVTAQP